MAWAELGWGGNNGSTLTAGVIVNREEFLGASFPWQVLFKNLNGKFDPPFLAKPILPTSTPESVKDDPEKRELLGTMENKLESDNGLFHARLFGGSV
ncbi:hypothetical protein SUGI_0005820 [Cryptomeria japonica]|nr:hypothetical protein SUGI_0005820 [Cryptomeria japonica]